MISHGELIRFIVTSANVLATDLGLYVSGDVATVGGAATGCLNGTFQFSATANQCGGSVYTEAYTTGGVKTIGFGYNGTGPSGEFQAVIIIKGLPAAGTVTSFTVANTSDLTAVVTTPTTTPVLSLSGGPSRSGIQQQSYTYSADTGTANAYAVTMTPAPTVSAPLAGSFLAAHANTGASTLAINGGTPIPIKKNGNSTALAPGDIAANQIIDWTYDGTVIQILVPGSGGGSGVSSLNSLTGALSIVAGSGVTVTPSGSNITIAATGGGGGNMLEATWTAPPSASSWVQENFNATYTSLTDMTIPASGVRIAEAVHAYGNTNLARYALRAIVSTHWSITARLRRHSPMTTYEAWGLVVRDSATGNSMVFGFDVEAGGLGFLKMASDTSYSGFVSLGGMTYQPNIWIRLTYDGTLCTMFISFDGNYWSPVYQVTSTKWGFLTNPATHYGFGYNANNNGNGGWAQEVDVLSWVETALP